MPADMNALADAPESPHEMGINDPDAFNREQQDKLSAALDEAQGYDEATADAIDALRDPTERGQSEVDLEPNNARDDTTVPVKNFANGKVERQLERIARYDEREALDLEKVREAIIECMAWFIEDDRFGQPHVWRAYAETDGTPALIRKFNRVTEPYLQAQEEVAAGDSFRGDE